MSIHATYAVVFSVTTAARHFTYADNVKPGVLEYTLIFSISTFKENIENKIWFKIFISDFMSLDVLVYP